MTLSVHLFLSITSAKQNDIIYAAGPVATAFYISPVLDLANGPALNKMTYAPPA